MQKFSFGNYTGIIKDLSATHTLMDYQDIDQGTENFAVIRHDVEFSVERALHMAEVEQELGVVSSYMFQIRNNAYNLFSNVNLEAVNRIYSMGHKVGLHVHLGMLKDMSKIEDYIKRDVDVMEKFLEIPVDRFSYHRPSKEALALNLKIDGLINTYEDRFFDFRGDGNLENLRVKYIADSMHKWNYGYPDRELLSQYGKVQLLIHPYSWTPVGYESEDNFNLLNMEKIQLFNRTVHSECKHFKKAFELLPQN